MGTKINPGRFDCYSAAAPDEPMFILLARDDRAAPLVEAWAELSERRGTSDAKLAEARECAASMRLWRKQNTLRLVDLRSQTRAKQGPAAQDWAEDADLLNMTESDLIELLESYGAEVRRQTIGAFDVAMSDAGAAHVRALRDLRDVATGKIQHVYGGICPSVAGEGDETERDRADPGDECPACEALRSADAILDLEVAHGSR